MGWRLAYALDTLSDEIRDRFPDTTIWTVGDADHRSRPSDHNPHDHDDNPRTAEVVSAIDVVGHEQAGMVWDHIRSTRDNRVEYMIHAGRMCGADTNWKVVPYRGSNPHNGHTHVSVGRGTDSKVTRPDLFDDRSPWGFSTSTVNEDNEMLKNGDEGNTVRLYQRALKAWKAEALPEYGADGDFGDETETWVKKYQQSADLPVTGTIGGVTAANLVRYVAGGVAAHNHDDEYAPKDHGHPHRHRVTGQLGTEITQ